MEIEAILTIVAKLAAALLAGGLVCLMPKISAFLEGKLGAEQSALLSNTVKTLVAAAEELLKEDDPTGEKRKAYVTEQLEALEVEVTNYVDALIESCVRDLGHTVTTTTKKTTSTKTTKK